MVSKPQSLQEIISRRVSQRIQQQRQARIVEQRRQIKRQGEKVAAEALREAKEARAKFEAGPQFRVTAVDVDKRGKVRGTFGVAKTQEEADKLQKEARASLGRDVSIGIERIKFGESPFRDVVIGPVPSERGRKLQSRRLELEKITKNVGVTKEGKIDITVLTRSQRARIRQLTGVKAEEAFSVAPPKPKTVLETAKEIESRKRQIRLAPKLKFETPAEARAAGFIVAQPKVLKAERALLGRDGVRRPDSVGDIRTVRSVPTSRLVALEKKIKAQKTREQEFFRSKGFERIETVAGFLTGGFQKRGEVRAVVPIEERGIIGRTAQRLIEIPLSFSIATGGVFAAAGEKAIITKEALEVPEIEKRKVREELFIEAPKRVVTEFKGSPLEEKIATGIFVAAAPFLGGGVLRRFATKQVTRTKAIKELTPTEKAKLERFELSVRELKGIRTQPERINLQEVERLTPRAAKALEKVILREKENIVVGGSVAQRTQIIGKSRIPEDIDIFTSRKPKELVEEIAAELKGAGVERVSTVRGKQITIKGKKAIEVKELGLLKQNIQKVQLPLQFVSSAFVKTPRGVRVLR